jgi:hypothetical protein
MNSFGRLGLAATPLPLLPTYTHTRKPTSTTHPTEAILTQAMARALAEEVHLDERYVAEHLRDALAGGWGC